MVAILEKSEHNIDFHQMVDFVKASPLRYALMFKPTIYVSHIQQFWSTARIETTEEGTQILATVDDVLRTVYESSLRRNLKLQDEEGISSFPDTKLFENLTLMGYNISLHKKFTFQKGQPLLSPPPCPMIQHQGLLPLLMKRADVEINRLKERVKILEDKEGVIGDRSGDDAPIKGRRIDEEEVATERLSNDTKEVRLDEGEVAAERASEDTEEMTTVLTTMDVATVLASGAAEVPTGSRSIPTAGPEVPTGSDVVPTASPVFATATVVTPYRRRKGKEVKVESKTLKKQKLQEQIDAQIAKELKEKLEREDQRRSEQIARDEEIVRIHVEEELQIMIDGLDRSNEESVKKHKISEEVPEEVKSSDEVPEEKIKEMMQLVPIEEVYVKALQVKHPDSEFDNPSIPLPPPEPPDEEFDFEIDFGIEISIVRNTIVKFECIDSKVKFDVFNDENDDLSYFMFVKVFSLLSAENEDTIFDSGIPA
nr:hypothetical protein [Tanacetum cinerariifolium]